jgi:hypothetical protein
MNREWRLEFRHGQWILMSRETFEPRFYPQAYYFGFEEAIRALADHSGRVPVITCVEAV